MQYNIINVFKSPACMQIDYCMRFFFFVFVWGFLGFQFLVQLLGNNLLIDELPGGAVEIGSAEDREEKIIEEDSLTRGKQQINKQTK